MRNGTYVSQINGHEIGLIYKGKNEAQLYIDGVYKGVCPFDCIKKKIKKVEENPIYLYNLKKADRILLKELRKPRKS
ncbi:MAG TPA: hypothetical protein VFT51_06615 [Bacillales bacterium]|nr:hypothetical protein [Bacillales bacterium]